MATIFLGQKSSLTLSIKVLMWTILSSCHQTSNVWIIPKPSEQVRSLILNYSTFFLELVLYWLILNIDSLLMWQFLSLFWSINCWNILSNKKKFENRNKDGILQSAPLPCLPSLWMTPYLYVFDEFFNVPFKIILSDGFWQYIFMDFSNWSMLSWRWCIKF